MPKLYPLSDKRLLLDPVGNDFNWVSTAARIERVPWGRSSGRAARCPGSFSCESACSLGKSPRSAGIHWWDRWTWRDLSPRSARLGTRPQTSCRQIGRKFHCRGTNLAWTRPRICLSMKNGTEKTKRQWAIYKRNRFRFVLLRAIRKIHNSQSTADAVHEGTIYKRETSDIALLRTVITMKKTIWSEGKIATVTRAIWHQEMSHSMFLSFLIPVSNITRSVIVPKAARLHNTRLRWMQREHEKYEREAWKLTLESLLSIFVDTRTLHSEAGNSSANLNWWQIR